uniref:Uncharacterized protein n=1 Tax=Lepeophtheirus salmonis TaxID=72036 RepID=A0A0K2T2R9_LEPSM
MHAHRGQRNQMLERHSERRLPLTQPLTQTPFTTPRQSLMSAQTAPNTQKPLQLARETRVRGGKKLGGRAFQAPDLRLGHPDRQKVFVHTRLQLMQCHDVEHCLEGIEELCETCIHKKIVQTSWIGHKSRVMSSRLCAHHLGPSYSINTQSPLKVQFLIR